MNLTAFNYNWDYWRIAGKVTFDGPNRLIIVNAGVTDIDISQDVYSAWKDWVLEGFGTTFPAAIRGVGGDPIDVTAGEYAGDLYFLINNWKLVYDPRTVAVTGILYSDNYPTAFYSTEGSALYPAKVSNIVAKQVNTVTNNVVSGDPDTIAAAVAAAINALTLQQFIALKD